ncbi:MAG: LysR family transcriptional regulator [Firmicutes bacterium]|nr:LysR family transcriptional regulator [Bacillota bacterium]
MNFTTLKYFLTAAEELNITRAAARLFISQQALSSHIGKLEAELGVKLFDRLPSLTLTYAGRRMVEYAQQAVNLERQIHQMAGDVNNDQVGELRVGISHTCGRAILPSILPRFRRTHPLVDIKLVEDNSAEMEKELRQGDLDLMIDFLPKPQEGLVHEELITERLFLVVPKVLLESSYGACLEPIKSECNRDLDMFLFEKFPFILLSKGNRVRKVLDAYMEKIGFKPKIILETENTETAYELAGRGMGVTVYPELFLWCIPRPPVSERPVEFFPLRDSDTTGTLVIAHMENHYQTKAAQEFVKACHEGMQEISSRQIV